MTTPNADPPPPRSAKKRSGCRHSFAMRYRPSGVTTLTWSCTVSADSRARGAQIAYHAVRGQAVDGGEDAVASALRSSYCELMDDK